MVPRQHTRRMLTCTAVVATGDVAGTSTSRTTVHHHSAVSSPASDPLVLVVTLQKLSKRRRTNSSVYVQELGIYSIHNTGLGQFDNHFGGNFAIVPSTA
jgi:hypothetical protein